MKLVEAKAWILDDPNADHILHSIEKAGRVAYKSRQESFPATELESRTMKFVAKLIRRGHESVLEHVSISVQVICDRGVSHEWVRHRIAAYTQESTRFCNYTQERFGNEITFIKPCFWEPEGHDASADDVRFQVGRMMWKWEQLMAAAEEAYFGLIELGAKPEEARSVLPISLKTEFTCTMNLRTWRHFFKLRTAPSAHPQMREITIPLLAQFKELLPVVFDDIGMTAFLLKQFREFDVRRIDYAKDENCNEVM